mmetsp:Transcript_65692/g.140495  ORF Transcript_65692/g.140495 Transcript_65692/m.140495 type:complete len:226 (+) Transcript_65692:168-845(+)
MVVAQTELVVDVNEAPLDILQHLDLMLQCDARIVALAQGRGLRHHHFQLHQVLRPEVVGVELVELHVRVVGLRKLLDLSQEVRICTLAHYHLDLLEPCLDPGVDDIHRDSDACYGVHHPEADTETCGLWRQEGRDVRDDIILIVLGNGLHAVVIGVPLGNSPAPEIEKGLKHDDAHEQCHRGLAQHDRWHVGLVPELQQPHNGGADHLYRCHAHHDGANHDPNGF